MRATGVYVALGSNLNEPAAQVRRALSALDGLPDLRVLRASSLYRTPPWGDVDQPDFVNAVAEIDTGLAPLPLLQALQAQEQALGRVRGRRYGPRLIDLDLLLYGDLRLDHPALSLPHPRMHERAFVMLPLAEIAPELELPPHGRAIDIAEGLSAEGIERLSV